MKKNKVESIRIADYSYNLPDLKIAKYPLQKRDESKLLLFENGNLSLSKFKNLSDHIPSDSLMVFNDTRVIHARLIFLKESGAAIEVFCLLPFYPNNYIDNFMQNNSCSWLCMIGNAKRWKNEPLSMNIVVNDNEIKLSAQKKEITDDGTLVEFSWDNNSFTFSEILEVAGKLPIPPYLNRASEEADETTYQTVYSKAEGSVAAPTGGLHFTNEVIDSLRQKGISQTQVTLHVGAGTFKPVKSETMAEHHMHAEVISVKKQTIIDILNRKGMLIVVGTTSMRTVESLYYLGCKIIKNPSISERELFVNQWEPYSDENENISPDNALKAIINYMENNLLETILASTQIIILPGYEFRYADALITNFHQPQSTLLLLVSAFVGDEWRNIYDFALNNEFRFLSYGDSSLLWK